MTEADPRVFDLFDPSEAVVAAEAIVKLPRDRNSLFQMAKIEKQISQTANQDEVVVLEEKAAALKAKVDESVLKVTLRGVDKIALDAISSLLDAMVENPEHPLKQGDRETAFSMKVLESMIARIEDTKGNQFAHPGERTTEWYDRQPPENRTVLMEAMAELSFKAYQYEADTVNPDF